MKKTIVSLMLALTSIAALAQHEHHNAATTAKAHTTPVFKDNKLGSAYAHYISLKDALVSSNADAAKSAAEKLKKSLHLIPDNSNALMEATRIAGSSDLNEQRKVFSTLSKEMRALITNGKLSSGALYVEYCPMANNNEGAFWLSNEKEIRNPYFGDRMLKCGSVKETVQ